MRPRCFMLVVLVIENLDNQAGFAQYPTASKDSCFAYFGAHKSLFYFRLRRGGAHKWGGAGPILLGTHST